MRRDERDEDEHAERQNAQRRENWPNDFRYQPAARRERATQTNKQKHCRDHEQQKVCPGKIPRGRPVDEDSWIAEKRKDADDEAEPDRPVEFSHEKYLPQRTSWLELKVCRDEQAPWIAELKDVRSPDEGTLCGR